MLRAVCVVGARNDPLFFRTYSARESGGGVDSSLRFHLLCHCALDILEDQRRQATAQRQQDFYHGLLCPLEEFLIYGLSTNTQLKVLAVLDDVEDPREGDVKAILGTVHAALVELALNPFSKLGGQIVSPGFAAKVARAVAEFNGVDAESAASAAFLAAAGEAAKAPGEQLAVS